jgi:hypothetical protein
MKSSSESKNKILSISLVNRGKLTNMIYLITLGFLFLPWIIKKLHKFKRSILTSDNKLNSYVSLISLY